MIRNYFKIAWRNLMANKTFTGINVVGLTVGLACCLLMVMYIRYELSFDKFLTNSDRLVRVIMSYSIGKEPGPTVHYTSAKVLPTFQGEFPEVESGIRMYPVQRLVKYGDKIINERNFVYADSTFFNILDFKLIQGDQRTVLNQPNTIVITESAAKKYFGDENPLNKTLLLSSKQDPYLITGVSADCPKNTQIKYDFVAPISSLGPLSDQTYWNANYTTYLLLTNSASLDNLQKKVNSFMIKEMPISGGATVSYRLEKFEEVHLHSTLDAMTPNTNILYVYIVVGMALLLLIIACFTYINLSTARSVERAREVGVRKVMGAAKTQLFVQFISESTLVTGASILLSLGLAALLIPYFNSFSGMNFSMSSLFDPYILGAGAVFFLIVAFLAGSYPALVLTGFNPLLVLKGAYKNTKRGANLGSTLTTFQFAISIFLIVSTLIVKNQMEYIQNKDIGYDKENVLMVDIDGKMIEKLSLIKSELAQIPGVVSSGSAYNSPLNILGGYNMSNSDQTQQMAVTANPIDESFITTCGMKLIAGENISTQDIKDAESEARYHHFVINKSAAKVLGWTPDQAIGQTMYLGEDRPGKVKGVVEDFHFASLHTEIKPLVLFPSKYNNSFMIKIGAGDNQAQVIGAIGNKLKELAPHRPFEYKFMDTEYQNMYLAEKRISIVFNIFAVVALFLACLGLFGLAMFNANQRAKEISIRKVLGASVGKVVVMLSQDFLKLTLIAVVLAFPLAYFIMEKWLQNFAYKTSVSINIFVYSFLGIVVITVLTVSYQAIKAAMTNPVDTLRRE